MCIPVDIPWDTTISFVPYKMCISEATSTDLSIHAGIACGEVLVGNIGTQEVTLFR